MSASAPMARPRPVIDNRFTRAVTFRRLEVASLGHSCIYLALLTCAFALGNPEPYTFVLGLLHGLLWIAMALICIAAARWRVIPFWLAVAVAILGGLGPFCGSLGFLHQARMARLDSQPQPLS